MPRKRSLADDLTELASAAPLAEPALDMDELGDGATLVSSEDDEPEEAPIRKRAKRAPERALRMRAAIDEGDGDYKGVKVSKAEAFSLQSDSADLHSATDSATTNQADADEAVSLDTGFADRNREPSAFGSPSQNEDDDDSETSLQGQEELGQAQENQRSTPEDKGSDAAAFQQVNDRLEKERAKGLATHNQHTIWDKILEMRILLQKSLSMSQQLPIEQDLQAAKSYSRSISDMLEQLIQEVRVSLSEMLGFQNALAKQNPAISPTSAGTSDADAFPEARAIAELSWPDLDRSYMSLANFRNSSLDQWYRKALLGGGASLKNSVQLFKQGISSQVMTMMKSSERLIKRTQPNIGGMPRRLCSCAGTHTDLERDPESFDDSDFYQQLLTEFLEASNPIGAHMPVAIKKKAKPLRDRRASKGRRLRYDVQEKLVNFMAPKRTDEPTIASQLFRNLFARNKAT